MHRFANPARFQRLAASVFPWSVAAAVTLFASGLYFALFVSPRDYQQGETVRIMYIHVPAAWMALFVYVNLAIASAAALVWKHPLADLAAKAMSPIGATFTFVCLVTGSLWGQPMWGTWWVWDARLTSELILLFLYLGYIALRASIEDLQRADRASAVLAIVGLINVPIIHYSVVWWNTLHQASSVTRMGAPTISTSMLVPLLMMILGFTLYFFAVLLVRVRGEVLRRERNALWIREAITA